jgi:hypothetical protein
MTQGERKTEKQNVNITEDKMVAVCSAGSKEIRTECWWGNPVRKIPLGRHRHGWENDIKTDLKEIRRECMECISVRARTVTCFCEHVNEFSDTTRDAELSDL